MPVVVAKDGLKLAEHHRPTIEQGFQRIEDLIVPVSTVRITGYVSPTVYVSVKESATYLYFLWCLYHVRDWSNWPEVVKPLDEHLHDFEGFLVAMPKDPTQTRIHYLCTLAHRDIICQSQFFSDVCVYVEPGGHGIHPWGQVPQAGNTISYHSYDIVDINGPGFQAGWSELKARFNANKVSMPDQWNHYKIEREFGTKTAGLIYTDPERFIELAKDAQLIKGAE